MYIRYEELLAKNGLSNYKISKETGISQATLSDWKNGKSTPKNDKLQIIADYFGVTLDYLLGKTDYRNFEEAMKSWGEFDKQYPNVSELNPKDEKDIAKTMIVLLEQLENQQEALMFDGEVIDDETRELLKGSLENSLKMGKKIAKQKYTPKKYKK